MSTKNNDVELRSFNDPLFDSELSIEELEERLELSPWVCFSYCGEMGEGCVTQCENCVGAYT
jgi:hypothetical protein